MNDLDPLTRYVAAPLAQKKVNHAVAMMAATSAGGPNGGGTTERADLRLAVQARSNHDHGRHLAVAGMPCRIRAVAGAT